EARRSKRASAEPVRFRQSLLLRPPSPLSSRSPSRRSPRRRRPRHQRTARARRQSASAAASAAGPGPMAAPGNNSASRQLLERIALAAVGAVALTAERAEALADELAERGGMQRDEARQLVEDSMTRWRGDA